MFAVLGEIRNNGSGWCWSRQGSTPYVRDKDNAIRDEPSVLRLRDLTRKTYQDYSMALRVHAQVGSSSQCMPRAANPGECDARWCMPCNASAHRHVIRFQQRFHHTKNPRVER